MPNIEAVSVRRFFTLMIFALYVMMIGIHHLGVTQAAEDAVVCKSPLTQMPLGPNLLKAGGWRGWGNGFEMSGELFVCDNTSDKKPSRGIAQSVLLDQKQAIPIVAIAESRSENVDGQPDSNYSLYLDLVYQDGSQLWGEVSLFDVGTHDWQQRKVVIAPEKPVRSVSFYMLLRDHRGKAWFRRPSLHEIKTTNDTLLFDSIPVTLQRPVSEGFLVRDVATAGPFVRIERNAIGLKLDCERTELPDSGQYGHAEMFDVTLTDTSGEDRAVTLVYAMPVDGANLTWLHDPRSSRPIVDRGEYKNMLRTAVGAVQGLGRYPMAGVASDSVGSAIGIDMAFPAVFRTGFSAGSRELYLAYDVALTPEKPSAKLRFVRYHFDPAWGFRSMAARYYEIFHDAFQVRTPRQGLWMPFAAISQVEQWEDFGFMFKEGTSETLWDDQHNILTFRYTEPMTWWMRMDTAQSRDQQTAIDEARKRAKGKDPKAEALLTSGYYNAEGKLTAQMRDTPWCNGAVWSINSMPGIPGDITDFKLEWNDSIRQKLYGPNRSADLDGEYIDSSEGYVTELLDYRRDHFAAAETPLTFDPYTFKPGIFRGLISFEYVRAIARDVHDMDRLMMANTTPNRLCWNAPLLDVMGTETDWNHGGRWQPMSDANLLYRRVLCKGKPYCFLMNTNFDELSNDRVACYMKRSLAYGMFPGFFSHNASEGHYFTRPALYNRDRELFKKYVPLCRLVAEAGWEPITLARSNCDDVYVERFGEKYLTILNDSSDERTVTIQLERSVSLTCDELVSGNQREFVDGRAVLTVHSEGVAVLRFKDPIPR